MDLRRLGTYARRNPLLVIEHLTLLVVVTALVRDRASRASIRGGSECACTVQPEGPVDVFAREDVEAAPKPTLNIASLKEGGVADYLDGRGAILKFKLAGGKELNYFKTLKGNKRAGALHNCSQYTVLLQGSTYLTTVDLATGEERVDHYGANELIQIPARVPHLFSFPDKDTAHLEWWDCEFGAWYYKPFRERVSTKGSGSSGGSSGGRRSSTRRRHA